MVGVSTTSTAQNVGSPMACTLGGGTFCHLKAAGKLGLAKHINNNNNKSSYVGVYVSVEDFKKEDKETK